MRQSARDSFGKDDGILENSVSKETKINRKPTKKVERSKSFLITGFKDGHTVKNALKKSASILYPNWLSKKSVSRKIAETNSVTIKRGFDNSKEFIDTFDHMPQKSKSRTSSAYHSDEYPTNLDIEGNSDYDHPSTQVKSVYQKSNQFKSDQSFDLANANRIGIPDNGASSSLERRWRSMTTLNQSIPQREGTDEGRRRVLPQPGSKSRARSFYLVEDILKEAGFDFEKKSRSNQSLNNIRHSFRGKSRHGDSEESLSRSPPPIPPRRLNRPAQPLGDFSPPDLSPADDNSESNSSERHWPSEPQSTKPKENFSRGEQLETGGSSIPMDPLLLERLLKDRMAWRLYPVYYHDWALPPLLLVDCGCSHCKLLSRGSRVHAKSPVITGAQSRNGRTVVPPTNDRKLEVSPLENRLDSLQLNQDEGQLNKGQRSPIPKSPVKMLSSREDLITDREVKIVDTGTSLSPQEALRAYGPRLTEYERNEIQHYQEIWFLGLEGRKIHGDDGGQNNAGYDDDNGSYNKVLHDHIAYRYEILEVIGKGSFGQVIRALDHKTGNQVAIKIIRNKKRFHHQALVEVRILDHLRRRDKDSQHNIIKMLDYFYFRNHLCISFELLSLNLYELIKKNNYQGFSLSLVRKFALSLIHCLRLLRRENIIHCDLKPENVLLKHHKSSSIKVIDFGSSCYTHQRVYTYIQSRFYRSPEVILGLPYGPPIDMWSLGCILAELFTGYPLFPGENEMEQLACIMEILGLPPDSVIHTASRRRLFFDSKGAPRCIANTKGRKRRPGSVELSFVLKGADANFVSFISKCLEWDPNKRMTPDEAGKHDWLSSISPAISSNSSTSTSSSDKRGKQNDLEIDKKTDHSIYRIYKARKNLCEDLVKKKSSC
ncbi:uncharacterized protein LOC136041241 isoform X2 [Artemia franciscana]